MLIYKSTSVPIYPSGKIVYSTKLGPFGNVEHLRKSRNIKQNYTGKFLDPESNLYYFHARYYNPVIGRFLSVDPGQDGNNWWVYAKNSPLVYVDPDGEFSKYFGGYRGFNRVGGAWGYIKRDVIKQTRNKEVGISVGIHTPIGKLGLSLKTRINWKNKDGKISLSGNSTLNTYHGIGFDTQLSLGVNLGFSVEDAFLKNNSYNSEIGFSSGALSVSASESGFSSSTTIGIPGLRFGASLFKMKETQITDFKSNSNDSLMTPLNYMREDPYIGQSGSINLNVGLKF